MASGEQMLALGQQLGQVLFENQALSERVDRLEEILMARGAGTLAPAQLDDETPEAAAPLNPMAEFAGIGAQAKDFLSQFQPQPAAPPTAPPKQP